MTDSAASGLLPDSAASETFVLLVYTSPVSGHPNADETEQQLF